MRSVYLQMVALMECVWRCLRQIEGNEVTLLDDSPLLPGLQLSFEAAAARFVILPEKSLLRVAS